MLLGPRGRSTMTDRKACLSCGDYGFKSLLRGIDGRDVQQCKKCGLGMTAKENKLAQSEDMYRDDYFTGRNPFGGDFFGDFWEKYDEERFGLELETLGRLTRVGKILDVGCATGNFLYYAKKRGWQVYGFDVSEFAVRCTQERTNATVATGSLGPGTFPEEFFDVVTLHHVLEHIEDPRAFLNDSLLPLLKHDGIVLIEVPNFSSLEARVLRGEWQDLRPEQHLWHFTPKALKAILKGVGVQSIRLRTLGNPLWRKRSLLDHPWMIAAALLPVPYRGDTGRAEEENRESAKGIFRSHLMKNKRSILFHISRIIGIPIMTFINELNMGKRLIAIGRKG